MGNCKWRHHFFCRHRLPVVSWAPLESLTTKENASSSAAIFLSNYTLAPPLHSPEHYHHCLSSHFSSTSFSVQIFAASKCQHQTITLQGAHISSKEDRIFNVNYFRKKTSYVFEPNLYIYIKLKKVPLFINKEWQVLTAESTVQNDEDQSAKITVFFFSDWLPSSGMWRLLGEGKTDPCLIKHHQV
jgi:hypothetical protein